MTQSETVAETKLYCCPRCGQALGPPGEDGRIEVTLASGDVWYVVQGVLDCACGVRQPVRRDERVVPPFIQEHYPNGATEKGEGENG